MSIKIKPLSVNAAFKGRRFKTEAYKAYEQELYYQLPEMEVPKKELYLKIVVGLSSKNADIDNVLKPAIDVMQKKYGFNDKQIYILVAHKIDVKKGKEFIDFEITNI